MYILKIRVSFVGSQIDVFLEIPDEFLGTLEQVYLLKFLTGFGVPKIDVSLEVPYKFPSTLDRCIS